MRGYFGSAGGLAAAVALLIPSSASALSRWHSCPSVHGGALHKTLALKTSCMEAQQVWNHFAGNRPSGSNGAGTYAKPGHQVRVARVVVRL